MKKVELKVRQGFSKGAISPRLFGSFVEHMGSVVYNGIFEPGHPTADKNGFRQDVLSYVKELSLGVIRYPGGISLQDMTGKIRLVQSPSVQKNRSCMARNRTKYIRAT